MVESKLRIDESEEKRRIWNIWMFIFSFTLSNMINGVVYDTYVNYLQEVSIVVARSFWSYYGYATFISAFLILLVSKIGYKWTLFLSPLMCTLSLFSVIYGKSQYIYRISTLLCLVGLQLNYVILAPFIATYTSNENKTKWYSRTYYIGYAGWLLTTYLGGALTVSRFGKRLGVGYKEAKILTEHIASFEGANRLAYIQGNKDVLFLTAILSLISLIPVILIREKKVDYVDLTRSKEGFREKSKAALKTFKNKYALAYILYWALISFGMGLFSPYCTVFLNRNLFINRATASFLESMSYAAMVVFILFTPKAVKKFGQIVTLAGVALISIPFMLLIANGNIFGQYMVPVVGILLFLRSGFMNLGSPIDSSLPMEIVPDSLRPAFSSVINIVSGLASILSGWFTGNYLFINQAGYKTAYYLASVIYIVACIILLVVFTKKYNRPEESTEQLDLENIVTSEV